MVGEKLFLIVQILSAKYSENVQLMYNDNVVRCTSVVESGEAREAVTLSVKNTHKKLDLRDGHVCVLGQRQTEAEYF